ncbi:MAG: nitroreductase [Saprospiraceae bacterium]|nr:nitroreductase [Saprospiraceae bacterium]
MIQEAKTSTDPDTVRTLIRTRRAIYPKSFTQEPISDEEIWELLEDANWAPTHKKTEPWRFKVFRGAARERLAVYLADHYKASTPKDLFSELKYEKIYSKPIQSACVIAICMVRDPRERLPEWEELAAVSCAVQNIWLSGAARGIGMYWSSPSAIIKARGFLGLMEGERCLGLLYMGRFNEAPANPSRGPIQDKVEWLTE